MTIKDLQPSAIWGYFYDITQIPRPSKKEERIRAYLIDFANQHNLEVKEDKAGNILITKPATEGKEDVPTVVLQSHVDMVCEKNSGVTFDFDNDPIETIIEGDWVKANGTTLGADNGIGVAAQLAVLAADDIAHGKIEALFTVDEETGLTGAYALGKDFFTGNMLINLDTEEEGEIYIGCAGGKGTKAYFKYKVKEAPKKYFWFKVTVKGLRGGHSGSDIDKGLGNANKILTRFLYSLSRKKYGMILSEIGGGNLHNAIPREAFAIMGIKEKYKEDIRVKLNMFLAKVQDEYKHADSNLDIQLESVQIPSKVIKKRTAEKLILALYACPHGVFGMSRDIEGLVETSTNLASVKMLPNHLIEIGTSQRSSVDSQKENIVQMVSSVFELAGAKVVHSEGYPGWQPNTESALLKLAEQEYQSLYDKNARVKAIHAGLECGLFLEKYPNLDMISIGPDMTDVHSPDEKMKISSVGKFWDYLVRILESIPAAGAATTE
ncbi:MAG: cytosol nonspecific dipeptidase [Bacteroidetes bacterium GWD2_45_23]|nr:MAG: cytosol nonspecific dipeptidase [Bacteroidetes bacterium GWC2_46_850]OFX76926.1 MAG: cytosol nonspecific dipeptidase [Bacteroidetes bacterium GWC1_47_7]OFX85062.1 MAG: cytosol nonspecific dipeptidase [Bacteroidetes bacterium GWD2_45_23]HAR37157.1 cytosol nonspecific dipeptidase [Porphyromonadaceae bacterium]HBB00373.1 cytosol nonspecific dipeptidase [Porphyromonadaceae bacterium]